MQPPKKKANVSKGEVTKPAPPRDPDMRKKLMAKLNIVEAPCEELEPEWTWEGFEYSHTEDLLNIQIADEYQDIVHDENGARLIIHSITVDNFKSYKGVHQLGPLHKNLTMILGPNGSGKSNVIDALLFVFGFKSNKIRTKKLTSLIHSDNECTYCKVEIHYQMIKDIDDEKYTVIPDSSFKISRSVQRDGFSQYKINETVATLKDVHDLLHRAGIDMTHNRFLILQGEVEAIALMRPTVRNSNAGEEGMLEYIEDIVGTNRFVEPIAKLAHRVRLLEMRASQFGVQVRRHTETMNKFYPAMVGAIAFINANNRMVLLTAQTKRSAVAKLKKTLTTCQTNMAAHKPDYEDKLEQWKQAKSNLKKAEHTENRKMAAIEDAINRKQEKESEITEFHMEAEKRKSAIAARTTEFKKLSGETEQLQKEKEAAEAVPEKSTACLEQIKKELGDLLIEEDEAQREAADGLVKYEQKANTDKERHKKLAEEYATKNEICIKASSELAVLTSELSEMKVTAGQGAVRLAEFNAALEQTTKLYKDEQAELDVKSLELINVSNEVEKANNELSPLILVEKDLNARKYQLERELVAYETDKKWNNKKMTTTMVFEELKAEGKFDGYIGRLGDLGYVEEKYDAPLSSNFGQLDHYVFKTPKDAEFAIDYVKKHKIGRINCIDMETVDANHYVCHRKLPVGKVVDIIQCDDPELMKVFHWAFSDCLLVKDIPELQRVDRSKRGEYRILSMCGTYMDRQGNFHGGGQPLFGRIRTGKRVIVKKKQISVTKTQKHLNSVVASLESTTSKIQVLREVLDHGNPKVRMLTQRCNELKRSIPQYTARIAELKKSIKEQTERLANPNAEVSEEGIREKRAHAEGLRKQLDKLAKDAEAAKKLVDTVQEKMDKMFVQFVQRHKDKVATCRDRINGLTADDARERAALDAAPKNIEALEARWKEHTDKLRLMGIDLDAQISAADVIADSKQLVILQTTLAGLKKVQETAEADLEEVKQRKQMLAEVEEQAHEAMLDLKVNYEQLEMMEDNLKHQIEAELEEIAGLDKRFMDPGDLDPHTTFVRDDAEDRDERLAEGAILLPANVLEKMEPYRERFEELTDDLLSAGEVAKLADEIVALENTCEAFRRKYDEKGITHYATLRALHDTEAMDYTKFSDQVTEHRVKLQQLRAARLKEFQEALTFLGTTTQMLYQLLTNGGDASLKFVEEGRSSDPFEAGVKFSVRPAKKSWKLIENLSGGEKTLASLCFVFAMHHYRATPLYVMDEIDAALDLNNVRLIANYIKHSERTSNAQFIIVSLRNQMFEVGNRLIGIYKTDGCTHNVVIAPERVESGNRQLKSTLDERIREETKKKNAEKEADEEEIVEGVQNLKIKRRRKLRRLNLSDFGLDDTDEDEEENAPPKVARLIPRSPTPPPRRGLLADDSPEEEEEEEEEEEYDEPVARKRRRQVAQEFDQEEDSPSPPPERTRKPTRGRRAARR